MRDHSRDVLVAGALAVLFGAVFLATSAPSLLWSDAAELQTAALTGGIAHPPGYPLFVMLGRVFGSIPLGEPARRITVMSALLGALCVACVYLLARTHVRACGAALAAAILYGTSFTFWWSAIGPEVYTLAVLLYLFAVGRCAVAYRTPTGGTCFVAAVCCGLALVGHLTFAPAVLVLGCVLLLRSARHGPALVAGLLVGLSPYAYIPLADHAGVAFNYLRYTIEPNAGQFGLTPATFDAPWERLAYMFVGHDSNPGYTWAPRALAGNAIHACIVLFAFELGPLALPFVIAGAARARAVLPRLVLGTAAASFVFAVLNDSDRLRPIFLLPCTLSCALLCALGLDALRVRRTAMVALVAAMIAAPHVVRVAAAPRGIAGHRMTVKDPPAVESLIPSLRWFDWPRAYGERVFALAPPGSMVIGKWKEITILMYLQSVDGLRRDVTLEPYDAAHRVRLLRWQDTHDLREHPFVLLTRTPELAREFADADSVRVDERYHLYVKRTSVD